MEADKRELDQITEESRRLVRRTWFLLGAVLLVLALNIENFFWGNDLYGPVVWAAVSLGSSLCAAVFVFLAWRGARRAVLLRRRAEVLGGKYNRWR